MRIIWTMLVTVSACSLVSGCLTGRRYSSGTILFEKENAFLYSLERDEKRARINLLHEHVITSGSTWEGIQYGQTFGGLITKVNLPDPIWLIYPIFYHDSPKTTRHCFGVGSGNSDLRLSLLWGMLSLGRNWNVFWINGFWAGKGDPVFSDPPPSVYDEFRSITVDNRENLPPASSIPMRSAEPKIVSSPSTSQPAATRNDSAAQLMKLKELKDAGFLTDAEYEAKRKALVGNL